MRIGVDIGGTKIEVIVLGSNSRELIRKRIGTPRGNYLGTLNRVKKLIETAEEQANQIENSNKPASIGIGIPGTISLESGLVKKYFTYEMDKAARKASRSLRYMVHVQVNYCLAYTSASRFFFMQF